MILLPFLRRHFIRKFYKNLFYWVWYQSHIVSPKKLRKLSSFPKSGTFLCIKSGTLCTRIKVFSPDQHGKRNEFDGLCNMAHVENWFKVEYIGWSELNTWLTDGALQKFDPIVVHIETPTISVWALVRIYSPRFTFVVSSLFNWPFFSLQWSATFAIIFRK